LLLNHALTLGYEIGGLRRFLSTTSANNRGENQKLPDSAHVKT